jgi:hypothetical protein
MAAYKHYSIAANPIFKIPDHAHPTPLKILKNSQGTMSNVGHGIIKKAPAVRPGLKEANLKEKQQNKNLHHCRKEVYTNCNEATSATPALTLRNA